MMTEWEGAGPGKWGEGAGEWGEGSERGGEAHGRRGAIPPYLLERLASVSEGTHHGTRAASSGLDTVAEIARRTLLTDSRLRRVRISENPGNSAAEAAARLHREVSDAEKSETLPGRLVRKEGQEPVADADVNRAYDGFGATYSFLEEVFGRSSLDGAGLTLEGTVHYGDCYDNAFWDGSRMVFGDGDGRVFRSFTCSLSIIAHELGHGLLQYTTDLAYRGQSGALNESFADIVGVMVEQHTRGQTAADASWIVGEGIFADGVRGSGVRSLAAPGTAYDDPLLGKDPQPDHMDGFVRTLDDSGGVHLNSGIPNHAFFLAATSLGGHSWERAGRVWFEAVSRHRLPADVDFRGFARETVLVARELYGRESPEERAVRSAWRGVGITVRLPARHA
ncbi:M4 family metallopeptidase [Sinomonas sp. JGH33]|uniref:Neutral metalloproteinase n=1 Tax=Sinomonas terricola TaxID=3110330 RepID=A0ABU5T888_9MICC|nr:M4 family metallopeptidase [Sinomonas sp. JGH33]MEA5455897.1 M4 family metallopeptidase [Sinomonas sp. JGH33]